ncbi:hypothetical protein VNO77_28401 [Canavalia gladiata]|uniref:Uncharacterized protein n=1 Tax=Canavalia gladiata TaxID=3824 RepID=A0AAN9QB68_CANGL
MRFGYRLNCSNLVCVLLGMKNDILCPLFANLLERWRYGVRCPIANHGNTAMCKGPASMASPTHHLPCTSC